MSPELPERLAAGVVAAYEQAELSLLQRIARALMQGFDAPAWAERQLFAVQAYRRDAERLLADLARQAERLVTDAVTEAAEAGDEAATAELVAALGQPAAGLLGTLPGRNAVVRLVQDAVQQVTSTHPRILRTTVDTYRDVIATVAPRALLGAETRRQTAQAALDRFARRGVTGFVDRSGRGWRLESYVEMAVRAGAMNATTQAHADKLTANGQDLVQVSDAPQECKLCRPFEGKILSLTGATVGGFEREHATVDGVTVRGIVLASLAEAKASGFMHPGCRHSYSLWLPGVTKAPTATADPEGDEARQRLRYLERKVRAAKREEAVALDDDARRAARAKVRAAQAAIREHVATAPAKRQPAREQIGRAI